MNSKKELMESDIDIFDVDYSEEFERIVSRRRTIRRCSILIPAAVACFGIVVVGLHGLQSVQQAPEFVTVNPPAPVSDNPPSVDTSASSRVPAESIKTEKPVQRPAASRRSLVKTTPSKPGLIATTASSDNYHEPDPEICEDVEEELRMILLRKRLEAEIEEKMKNQSQTPESYIL